LPHVVPSQVVCWSHQPYFIEHCCRCNAPMMLSLYRINCVNQQANIKT